MSYLKCMHPYFPLHKQNKGHSTSTATSINSCYLNFKLSREWIENHVSLQCMQAFQLHLCMHIFGCKLKECACRSTLPGIKYTITTHSFSKLDKAHSIQITSVDTHWGCTTGYYTCVDTMPLCKTALSSLMGELSMTIPYQQTALTCKFTLFT